MDIDEIKRLREQGVPLRDAWKQVRSAEGGEGEGPEGAEGDAGEGAPGPGEAEEDAPRPVIALTEEEPAILAACRAVLAGEGPEGPLPPDGLPPYYTGPAGTLVCVDDGRLRPVSAGEVREVVGLRAQVVAATKNGRRALPVDTAARVVECPLLPRLVRVAPAPYLRRTGTVVTAPGYDEAEGVYLAPSRADYPSPPEDPAAALATLRGLFTGCTVSPTGADGLVALVLTVAGRNLVEGPVPAWLALGHTSGSGKTSATLAALAAATGRAGGVAPWPGAAAELKKTLGTVVDAGGGAVVYDNLPNGGTFGGGALDAILTAAWYSDRRLGTSETIAGPAPVIALTGNNVRAVGDVARRLVVVPFESRAGAPDGDLVAGALDAHPRALVAALVLLGAALRRRGGAPLGGRAFPSYGAWCEVVRDAILLAGGLDVAPAPDDRGIEDEDADGAEAFVSLARRVLGARAGEGWTTADLVVALDGVGGAGAAETRQVLDEADLLAPAGGVKPRAVADRLAALAGRPTPAGRIVRARLGEDRRRGWVLA